MYGHISKLGILYVGQPCLRHAYEFLPNSFEMLQAFLQVLCHLKIDTLSFKMTHNETPNYDLTVQ